MKVTIMGNETFKAAMAREPPQPLHKRMIQLYIICATAYLCSSQNGYDGSLMGNMLVLPAYQNEFGAGIGGVKTGYISAMYTIGGVCSLPFIGPLTDTWGRRWGMFIGCGLLIIGTVIEGTSFLTASLGQFLGGRFLLGFGVSVAAAAAAPIYVVELAHPAYRGVMTGLYNTIYNVGSITAGGALRGGEAHGGNASWLIPTWIQMLWPLIVCSSILLPPESPRWLFTNGKQEEARAIMTKYHGLDNPDSVYVTLQVQEFEQELNLDGSDKRWWDYRSLFKNRASRYRVFCNVTLSIFGQWSGNGLTTYFLPAFLSTAGVTNAAVVLDINLALGVACLLFSMAGASLVERFGRRKLFYRVMLGISFWWVLVTICAGVFSNTGSKGAGDAAIFMVFAFQLTYAFASRPCRDSTRWRSCRTSSAQRAWHSPRSCRTSRSWSTNLACPLPSRISGGMIFGFICWTFIQAMVAFFFFVETKGRTLEELDEIFNAPNPRNASLAVKKITLDSHDNLLEVKEVA